VRAIILILAILCSGQLLAGQPLNCSPQTALRIVSVMPVMGATNYSAGRYAFRRSTCGTAEKGFYCLGRDYDDRLHDPVYQQAARTYQQGLIACGVPQDTNGRWQTGEIRCRGDRDATCRIFPPSPVPANWPRTAQRRPESGRETTHNLPDYQPPYYPPSTGQRSSRQIIEEFRAAGIQAADDAFARNGHAQTRQLRDKLATATITHTNQTPCGPSVVGCAEAPGVNMYLTDLFFDLDPNEQLHVILHETAHLIGIANECASDRLSRKIRSDAGLPISPSFYDRACGQ
jgi:hypothetical protein